MRSGTKEGGSNSGRKYLRAKILIPEDDITVEPGGMSTILPSGIWRK